MIVFYQTFLNIESGGNINALFFLNVFVCFFSVVSCLTAALCAKIANEFQIRAVFSSLFIGKSLFGILKCLFDFFLFNFHLVEPALAESDTNT